uniref:Uncharacterized protein n=1 Tax=Anguilla anguilla TaxID=7936 RepID=A0A0E9S5E8_ANGAN
MLNSDQEAVIPGLNCAVTFVIISIQAVANAVNTLYTMQDTQ